MSQTCGVDLRQVGLAPAVRRFIPFLFCHVFFPLFVYFFAALGAVSTPAARIRASSQVGSAPRGHRFLPFRFCRVLFILSVPGARALTAERQYAVSMPAAGAARIRASSQAGSAPVGIVSYPFGSAASCLFCPPPARGRSRQSGSMRCPCPRQVRHASGLRLRLVRRRWASFPTISVLPRLVYFVRPRRAGAHGRAAVCGVHARGRCGTHPGFVSGWFGAEASLPALSVLPRLVYFVRPRRAGTHGRAAVCDVHARGRCGTHPGFVSGWFGAARALTAGGSTRCPRPGPGRPAGAACR